MWRVDETQLPCQSGVMHRDQGCLSAPKRAVGASVRSVVSRQWVRSQMHQTEATEMFPPNAGIGLGMLYVRHQTAELLQASSRATPIQLSWIISGDKERGQRSAVEVLSYLARGMGNRRYAVGHRGLHMRHVTRSSGFLRNLPHGPSG